MDDFSLYLLSFIFWPVIIIGLIVYFVRRRRRGVGPDAGGEYRYLRLAFSKEDALSQFFLLLFVCFLGIALLAFNRDLGDPFSWRTILFLTSIIGIVTSYYFKVFLTLAFSLVGVALWWGVQAAEWIEAKHIKESPVYAGLLLIALLFYALGYLHEREPKYKRFAMTYLVIGTISVTYGLFFFSTKPGLRFLEDITAGAPLFDSWRLTVSFLLIGAFLIAALINDLRSGFISGYEALAVIVLALLAAALAVLPQQDLVLYPEHGRQLELSGAGVFWAIIFNAVIFLELVGMIFSGYTRREEWLINLGALFLFLLIIIKYLDWFFAFLDKSFFFIGAGILLLAVGWFMERGRRYMISSIKGATQQPSG